MLVIPVKNLSLWVAKQKLYMLYIRNKTKTIIFKNIMPKILNLIINYNYSFVTRGRFI